MESSDYVLWCWLVSGQTFAIRLAKDEAITIAEQWSDWQKETWIWNHRPLRWSERIMRLIYRVTGRLPGVKPRPIPFVGGLGWGVLLENVLAVHAAPYEPPKPCINPDLIAKQEKIIDAAIEEMKEGDKWKTDEDD